MGDILIFTNGKVAPRSYDGTTWATAGSTQLAAPIASAGSSGNKVGTYKFRLVPVRTDGTRKVASVASSPIAVQDKQITLTWTADADVTVGGYEIYSTSGTGEVYYFEDYVDGRLTTSYTANAPGLTILENRVMQEHGDAPPQTYHCEAHKQRMWYFRTDTDPQTGWWSDPGDPDSVYNENQITFADAETIGDEIKGALGDYEGLLVVFEERSIWTVSGTGQVIGNIVDWTRTRTNAQTGTVSIRTVVRIPVGSRYIDQIGKVQVTNVATLAYLTPLLDIRIFDGDNDIIISHPKKELLATLNYEHRHKAFALHDTFRSEVTWLFPTGSCGEPNKAVTWNYRWGVWYERDWAFSHAVEIESTADSSILLAGSNSPVTGGFCYQLWNGNSFDGSPIQATWMTKTLYGVLDQAQPGLAQTKRWRWADFLFEMEQTVTLTVEWMPGNVPDNAVAFGTTSISPALFYLVTASGDGIDSASADDLTVSQASSQTRAVLKTSTGDYLHDTGIRFRVGDNAALGSWSLEAFALAYQILPGLQRRMP